MYLCGFKWSKDLLIDGNQTNAIAEEIGRMLIVCKEIFRGLKNKIVGTGESI